MDLVEAFLRTVSTDTSRAIIRMWYIYYHIYACAVDLNHLLERGVYYQPSIREGCVLSANTKKDRKGIKSERAMREREGQRGEGAKEVRNTHLSDLLVFGFLLLTHLVYIHMNYIILDTYTCMLMVVCVEMKFCIHVYHRNRIRSHIYK